MILSKALRSFTARGGVAATSAAARTGIYPTVSAAVQVPHGGLGGGGGGGFGGTKRYLNLHEYQSAQIMKDAGVNVPFGIAASSVQEAIDAAQKIGDDQVVIKSQILAGGRGLGTFTNGLQGGVHIIDTGDVKSYAEQMLGGTLVTKQSGPAGKPVNTVLLAKKMSLAKEFYFAIMMDRATQGAFNHCLCRGWDVD